jgi:hypothetical protein
MNSSEMHSILVDHGWRMSINGHWISPHPEDSRIAICSLSAAWQVHLAHTQPEGD